MRPVYTTLLSHSGLIFQMPLTKPGLLTSPPADPLAFPPSISWRPPPFAISGSVACEGGVRGGVALRFGLTRPRHSMRLRTTFMLKRSKNGAVCG